MTRSAKILLPLLFGSLSLFVVHGTTEEEEFSAASRNLRAGRSLLFGNHLSGGSVFNNGKQGGKLGIGKKGGDFFGGGGSHSGGGSVVVINGANGVGQIGADGFKGAGAKGKDGKDGKDGTSSVNIIKNGKGFTSFGLNPGGGNGCKKGNSFFASMFGEDCNDPDDGFKKGGFDFKLGKGKGKDCSKGKSFFASMFGEEECDERDDNTNESGNKTKKSKPGKSSKFRNRAKWRKNKKKKKGSKKLDSCPKKPPMRRNRCSVDLECYYGAETCCGVEHPVKVCTCWANEKFVCEIPEFCKTLCPEEATLNPAPGKAGDKKKNGEKDCSKSKGDGCDDDDDQKKKKAKGGDKKSGAKKDCSKTKGDGCDDDDDDDVKKRAKKSKGDDDGKEKGDKKSGAKKDCSKSKGNRCDDDDDGGKKGKRGGDDDDDDDDDGKCKSKSKGDKNDDCEPDLAPLAPPPPPPTPTKLTTCPPGLPKDVDVCAIDLTCSYGDDVCSCWLDTKFECHKNEIPPS